jgi:hypothetical protein
MGSDISTAFKLEYIYGGSGMALVPLRRNIYHQQHRTNFVAQNSISDYYNMLVTRAKFIQFIDRYNENGSGEFTKLTRIHGVGKGIKSKF